MGSSKTEVKAEEFHSTAEAVAALEAQGRLWPSKFGWWKVWGASVHDIRVGDLVATKGEGPEDVDWMFVLDTFVSKSHPINRGFIESTNGSHTMRFTLGALCPVVVFRQSTHNLLAGGI